VVSPPPPPVQPDDAVLKCADEVCAQEGCQSEKDRQMAIAACQGGK